MTDETATLNEDDAKAEPCFRLIYRSRSLLPEDNEGSKSGLAEILKVARQNNQRLGVTGALILYEEKQRFAQVLEGPEHTVKDLLNRIKADSRHDSIEVREAGDASGRLFTRWAMALVLEHHEPDVPLIGTTGGISEAAPWRVTPEQEAVLTRLKDMTRGYGRGY
ncbi:MAG: BLUF domain-containing protein [Geminicoccales bacterium]